MVSTAKEDGFSRRRLPPEISFHGKTTRSERRRRRRSVARSTPSFGVAEGEEGAAAAVTESKLGRRRCLVEATPTSEVSNGGASA
mgnify:CR=1 FL=1